MSWIWLDGIETFEKAKRISAWKKWESQFPQTYLIEMMAQAGAILLGAESDFGNDVVFIKIEEVEFLTPPRAGKRLDVAVEAESLRKEAGWFRGEIFQEGEKVAKGRVLLMNVGRLRADGEGPITFPASLIEGIQAKCPGEE